jgi:hypothetical protein
MVEPPSLSLFPGGEQQVVVRFAPPRTPDVKPGVTPFGVRVISREDPDGSVVEEGSIAVGKFEQRAIELYPPTNRGRRQGVYELAIDNRGNAPIDVAVAGSDPENICRFRFAQDVLRVEPGAATFTKLKVAPVKRFWKGPPKTHQFQVLVTAEEHPPEIVPGTYMQEALLPPWIVKAVLAAAAVVLVLFILWQTLFKSTVETAARDAVEEPLEALTERIDEVAPTTTTIAGQSATTTTAAGEDGGDGDATTTTAGGGQNDGGTTTSVGGGSGSGFSTAFGDPIDFQLGIGSPVPAGTSLSFTQPFTKNFAMTDMVLQNPGGDSGVITITRNGAVLKSSALENFRDYDLHLVAPYVFRSGQDLVLTINCTTPGPTNTNGCQISASFSGFEK